MTNQSPPESEMLKRVRAWRKEAYEAGQAHSPQERAARRKELLHQLGLPESELPERRRRRAQR